MLTVAAILLVMGLLASLVPAWRATRVDPMIAIRAESRGGTYRPPVPAGPARRP